MRREGAAEAEGRWGGEADKDKNQLGGGGGGVKERREMRARWEYRATERGGKQRQETEEKRSKKRGNNARMKGRGLPVVRRDVWRESFLYQRSFVSPRISPFPFTFARFISWER